MFFTFLIILIALIAVLMTLVVLLQSGQGGGLAGIGGGGATRQVLGNRQAPDLLERATWTLAALFIVLCLLTNFAIEGESAPESIIQQQGAGQTEQALPPGPSQGAEPGGQQAPAPAQEPPASQEQPAPQEDG